MTKKNQTPKIEFEHKTISVKEFRELGYLQELNRRFLHPLGLALSVKIDLEGFESLDRIFDYRHDNEGIFYDIINSDEKRIERFKKRLKIRKENLGFGVEEI